MHEANENETNAVDGVFIWCMQIVLTGIRTELNGAITEGFVHCRKDKEEARGGGEADIVIWVS